MKKTIYQLYEQIDQNLFLHFCTSTNSFILMNRQTHNCYMDEPIEGIRQMNPSLYRKLSDCGFIIEAQVDERTEICDIRNRMKFDTDEYHLVINTTLDCNLDCWYCYENRIAGSRLTSETISLIKKNIECRYDRQPFSHLKISFFGGEPFMDFDSIKDILDFAKDFTERHRVRLTADFTTNATLIDELTVEYLKPFYCNFQITLDGNRERHNKIKFCKADPFDTYQATLKSLRLINQQIENRYLSVRINFDNKTLTKIDEILNDIDFLDRSKSLVILKRIWQVDESVVDHDLLLESIGKVMSRGFLLDYYVMPKGCLCFADRESQALFNYDGNIFKCTTISNFNEVNRLGTVNASNGEIVWDRKKTSEWMKDFQQTRCLNCPWFPVCLGICNRQIIANPDRQLCNLEGLSISRKEYLMYLFKYSILQRRLSDACKSGRS